RKTLVIWDIEDYTIPEGEGLDLDCIKQKIEAAIKKEGFDIRMMLTIWVFGGAENSSFVELKAKFWDAGFRVHPFEGDKLGRFNTMFADVAIWSFSLGEPANLLILSEEKENMEHDLKFCRFRQALENKGFTVASEHPDILFNQETAVEEEPPQGLNRVPYYDVASDGSLTIAYWPPIQTSDPPEPYP
ncbi:hypothetical protein CARUB_v10006470mg, partial [Capsella rubella]